MRGQHRPPIARASTGERRPARAALGARHNIGDSTDLLNNRECNYSGHRHRSGRRRTLPVRHTMRPRHNCTPSDRARPPRSNSCHSQGSCPRLAGPGCFRKTRFPRPPSRRRIPCARFRATSDAASVWRFLSRGPRRNEDTRFHCYAHDNCRTSKRRARYS